MSAPPKPKAEPKSDRQKKKRGTGAGDPAQKARVITSLPLPAQPSNGSVVIPVEISVDVQHALEKPNIGWSHRRAGQNVERAIAIHLNPANQLTASAIIRKDQFMVRWLAALLLCEFLAIGWRRSAIIAELQRQLIRTSFKESRRNLFFPPLAHELVRKGMFDSLELGEGGELSFLTTIKVTVPQSALAEEWLWRPPYRSTEIKELGN